VEKATEWENPASRPYPVALQDLLAFAFSWYDAGGTGEILNDQPFSWWHQQVTRVAFPAYCRRHAGPFYLPTNVMLKVARHLKYYYDQVARDRYENEQWEWVP
jgi:hypothetical protein